MEALTLPGIDTGPWQVRNRFDGAAAALANRHYSRERVSNQTGGPGFIIVMVTPCERAVWVSKRHSPATKAPRVLAGGALPSWRCTIFRNEGAGRSSDLIRSAMALTRQLWGYPPPEGWMTWVDTRRVRSANPGYCFKQAGWWRDSWIHPYLVRLRAEVHAELRSE